MEIYNVTQAKANLSKILATLEKTGEPVYLARGGKKIAALTIYEEKDTLPALGFYNRKIHIPDDFDDLPDEVAAAFGMTEN